MNGLHVQLLAVEEVGEQRAHLTKFAKPSTLHHDESMEPSSSAGASDKGSKKPRAHEEVGWLVPAPEHWKVESNRVWRTHDERYDAAFCDLVLREGRYVVSFIHGGVMA